MSELPTISLVIVTQDRREELKRLLSALRFQRMQPSEILIISNLTQAERPQSELNLIWLPTSGKGISADRNVGIKAASGKIVAFCDDDTVPEFSWLEQLVNPLGLRGVSSSGGYVRGRNGVSFKSQTVFFDRYGRDWQQDLANDEPRIYPPQKDMVLKTPGANCAFKREDLCDIGCFDEAYRFFLDEVDVNIRFSDAGRQAAIVPKAEVHQSNAPSPWRTSRRVPESLFEIGASKAHFCQQYANLPNIERLLPEFAKQQDDRLRRLFQYGLVDSQKHRALSEELLAGFKEGRFRNRALPEISSKLSGSLDAPISVARSQKLVLTNQRQRKRAFNHAKDAAEAGNEVTVFVIEYTIRPLCVWFDPRGFWVHRIGIFGRDDSNKKIHAARSDIRVTRELKRTEPQRQLSADTAALKDFR